MAMPKVLILEDNQTISDIFRALFRGEPFEIVLAETAAGARELFERDEFNVIALDSIAPSEPGRVPSLVGPLLAREFRGKGYKKPLIAISSDPRTQQLLKQAGCSHLCEKERLHGLVQELLGLWPTTPA